MWLGKQHRGQPRFVARKKGEFRPILGRGGRRGRRRARRNHIHHRGTEFAEDADLIFFGCSVFLCVVVKNTTRSTEKSYSETQSSRRFGLKTKAPGSLRAPIETELTLIGGFTDRSTCKTRRDAGGDEEHRTPFSSVRPSYRGSLW